MQARSDAFASPEVPAGSTAECYEGKWRRAMTLDEVPSGRASL
jgi:hypothetical protein